VIDFTALPDLATTLAEIDWLAGPPARVTITFLSDAPPVETLAFRLSGVKWEPGDDEITYIDEVLEP